MDWIDEAFEEVRRMESKKHAVDSDANKLFVDLWTEIIKQVEKLTQKGRPLYTNGSPHSRVVATSPAYDLGKHLRIQGDAPMREECRISLEDDKISVRSKRVNLTFVMEEDKDHVLHLTLNDQRIESKDAAQSILKPFAFPFPELK